MPIPTGKMYRTERHTVGDHSNYPRQYFKSQSQYAAVARKYVPQPTQQYIAPTPREPCEMPRNRHAGSSAEGTVNNGGTMHATNDCVRILEQMYSSSSDRVFYSNRTIGACCSATKFCIAARRTTCVSFWNAVA